MRRGTTRYIDLEADSIEPVVEIEWWKSHVNYSSFNRQGIDIFCASFENPNATARVIFLTGFNESFLKYSELFKLLYDAGYSIYTYDHQSQGLSGRWLMEEQTTWIYSFDDYIQDFLFFANMIKKSDYDNSDNITTTSNSNKNIPLYCIAHSMGGLIASVAMSKNRGLFDRLILSAPGFRFKCSMKATDYAAPLPLPLAYIINYTFCLLGLGQIHCLGWFKEKSTDPISEQLTTCKEQRELQRQLRIKVPSIISCCPTCEWLIHCLDAQEAFAAIYASMHTPCIIFKTIDEQMDLFVHNRAIEEFAMRARSCRVFEVENSKHEILLERPKARGAVHTTILNFFKQEKPEVNKVEGGKPGGPLRIWRPSGKEKEWPEVVINITITVAATVGLMTGLSLMISSYKK